MTQYERRLQHDLDALRASVCELATDVESNLREAVRALLAQDADLAYRTILRDHPVNRKSEAVEAQAHRFIAKHLPSAGHLRFVSSVMRMAILLERMGDYGVTICRETTRLGRPLEGIFRDEVRAMAEDAFQMFTQAVSAFREADVSLARGTIGFAEQVDRDFSLAFNHLLREESSTLQVRELFSRLIVITRLERVSDQAKNLCEETIFALTGETKKRRPVRVLFLDGDDAGAAQMAVAIGRKQYADRGEFWSAGLKPASGLDAHVREFMETHGYDMSRAVPQAIRWVDAEWERFDVLIALSGDVTDYVRPVPLHSVALSWTPGGDGGGDGLEAVYRFLSMAIGELVDTMRGPGENTEAR